MLRKLILTSLLFTSCTTASEPRPPIDILSSLSSNERQSINTQRNEVLGVWRSRGYGWILEISPTNIRQFEVGNFGCFERSSKVKAASPMLSLNFSDYFISEDRNTAMFLYAPDSVGPVFDRIDHTPQNCYQKVSESTENVLNVFLSIMSEHYAHFGQRGVNWEEAKAKAKYIFQSDPTESGLKASMQYVIELLQDSHTRVIILSDDKKTRVRAGLGQTLTAIRKDNNETPWLIGIIDQLMNDVLDSGAKHVGEDRIIWGTIDQSIGYLQVFQMGGFSGLAIDDPEWANSELETMNAILDEAFAHFLDSNVQAVILDLSNNRGGYDEIARQLAARFANEPFHAYNVSARGSEIDPLKKIITPSSRYSYLGSTYVMTSDVTVSGGEIATLSLKQLNNVTQVGVSTRGSFSTPLAKALPNNWVVELANETFTSPNGTIYSGSGLPPDVQMTIFDSENPILSHGVAIEQVVNLITEKGTK